MPDIDIDFADRDFALKHFKHIPASRIDNSEVVKHNTGVYFHEVPTNPITGLCEVEYKHAEDNGFFKVDFLNVSIYKDIRDEEHLLSLVEKEPLWDLLEQDDFVNLLFHLSGYGDILRKLKPRNVEQLAAILAIIRPAKRHLVDKDWNTILKEVWKKPEDGSYYFKKSHSIAYAITIVVQMNLICEQV